MLNFLIDNIVVVFGDTVFQHTIGIPMGTNCAPLLVELAVPVFLGSRIRSEAIF